MGEEMCDFPPTLQMRCPSGAMLTVRTVVRWYKAKHIVTNLK